MRERRGRKEIITTMLGIYRNVQVDINLSLIHSLTHFTSLFFFIRLLVLFFLYKEYVPRHANTYLHREITIINTRHKYTSLYSFSLSHIHTVFFSRFLSACLMNTYRHIHSHRFLWCRIISINQ